MSRKPAIGVISDTHGLFDSRIPALFTGVDHILHAGDIGNIEVYYQLEALAPVTAISGNVDEGILPPGFRPQRTIELYGVRIFMIHILGDPHHLRPGVQRKISGVKPDVLIFGHSHQPFLQQIGSTLFFNPGSAGPKRFSLPRCVGFLEIDKGHAHARLVSF
jgi:uncharacterized protein